MAYAGGALTGSPAAGRWRTAAHWVFYVAGLALAGAVVGLALRAADLYRRLAELSDSEGRTRLLMDRWLEGLSLGYYNGASETTGQIALLEAAAARHEWWAGVLALALGTASLVFLGWKVWGWYRGGTVAGLLRHAFGVSAVFLAVGLLAPIFTLSAFGDVPVLGRVVLSYEIKSVVSMIGGLMASGNWPVAMLLALFSVVTPVVKVLLSLMVLGLAHGGARRAALAVVHHVGRWSMTDVFVVAVLLAFLAGNQQQTTDAGVGLGLYFFAAYAVLSLAAGHLLVDLEARWSGPRGAS